MNDPSPPAAAGPVAKLFGALLMAVGALIAVLSGLCSLAFLGTMVSSAAQNPGLNLQGAGMILLLVLVFGGMPLFIGVGLFVVGRSLYRRR